ncbi:class I SAM-dependent methyltransferase [Sungkyunkwania multivorans]|uniref:Class I SAM-dependent methyltransferase n=1 Tax=Sungkyunkwania multivorans TaxID=1173618 RepID=A0ABW3D1Z7_9FLAO
MKLFKSIIRKLPYARGLYAEVQNFKKNSCYPAGHYYSPIVSVDEIKRREKDIWKGAAIDGIAGIDLNTDRQRSLAIDLSKYYEEMPFEENPVEGLRYKFDNNMYRHTDGILLYGMLRHLAPKRIIEVGSGHSSALMLDVNQRFFNNEIDLTFIEPYPERLFSTITDTDKVSTTIFERDLQEMEVSYFKNLGKGDILFIDSTHIAKCGSDVNYILFEILPALHPGVFIHFHDIFYPFEYPKGWVYGGRNWNENYILRAFLMNNENYKIQLFSDYLHKHHSDVFEKMPLAYKDFGGDIWLEKIK